MFTTDRDTLVATLLRLRAEACVYEGDPCDCKYGRGNEPAKGLRPGMTEMTGCPELAQAALIIFQLTEDEFERYSKNLHGRGAAAMSGFPAEMKRHREEDRALRALLGEVPRPEDVADGLRKDYARPSSARREATRYPGKVDELCDVEGESARTIASRAFLDVRHLAVAVERTLALLAASAQREGVASEFDEIIEEMRRRGLANSAPAASSPTRAPSPSTPPLPFPRPRSPTPVTPTPASRVEWAAEPPPPGFPREPPPPRKAPPRELTRLRLLQFATKAFKPRPGVPPSVRGPSKHCVLRWRTGVAMADTPLAVTPGWA